MKIFFKSEIYNNPNKLKTFKWCFKKYEEQITKKNPFKAKMASTFILYCLGDIFCQKYVSKKTRGKKIDFNRTLL